MAIVLPGFRNWFDQLWVPLKISQPRSGRFGLRPWFAAISLFSISLLAIVGATVFSRMMTARMLAQEGTLTMEFVQSTFLVEKPSFFFDTAPGSSPPTSQGILMHLANLPDVLRANVYTADKLLLWSSDANLIGKRFPVNPELDRALAGQLVVDEKNDADAMAEKSEHADLEVRDDDFPIEIYVPVWDEKRTRVLGAVELYKQPRALSDALRHGVRIIWGGAAIGGLFLYLMLFWLVSRADRLISDQHGRLVDSERLAAIGELGSAVAHGIRNPLTAIRSSAELALEGDPELAHDAARDIIVEADRLERWINELLSYSRQVSNSAGTVDLSCLLQRCVDDFARDLEKRDIVSVVHLEAALPRIVGDSILYLQIINSLIANAIEAINIGGSITIAAGVASSPRRVQVTIRDNGPGMTPDHLAQAFKPFFTTKSRGLGVGLPLAKRVVERFGGSIHLRSDLDSGTTVTLAFQLAAGSAEGGSL